VASPLTVVRPNGSYLNPAFAVPLGSVSATVEPSASAAGSETRASRVSLPQLLPFVTQDQIFASDKPVIRPRFSRTRGGARSEAVEVLRIVPPRLSA
jgi:hypothetical protein